MFKIKNVSKREEELSGLKLVASAGSNWQHHPEIARNGWKGFDFGLEVGPSYFNWLELIDSIDGRALR